MTRAARASLAGLVLLLVLALTAVARSTPAADPSRDDAAAEAQGSFQAGMLAMQRGAAAEALAAFDHARTLYQHAGDHQDEAGALLAAGLAGQRLRTPDGNAKALGYLTEAIPLFAAMQDRRDQATALAALAGTYEAMGRAAEARDAYVSALALLDAPDQQRQRANALVGLAGMEQMLGDVAGARAHAEAALPLLAGPQDAPARLNALLHIGMACDAQDDRHCAADAFLQAADLARALGNQQAETFARRGGALDLVLVGKSREAAGDVPGAIASYARAAETSHRLNDRDMEAAAQLNIARLRQATGDTAGALVADEAALAAAGDGPMRLSALVGLAGDLNLRGNYPRALEVAEEALPLLTSADAASQRATMLLIAGNAAAGVHDTARALRYLTDVEGLGDANPGARAGALAERAEIAIEEGDASRGGNLAREAMRLHQQLKLDAAVTKDRVDLAAALAAMGRRDEALTEYDVALRDARASHNVQQEAATLGAIARVQLEFGDLAEAVALFRQAQDAARRSGDRDTEARVTAQLGMAYHAQGDQRAAIEQLNAAIAIRRDSQDRHGEALELNDLALVKSDTGDPQGALDLFAETRATFATMADRDNEAVTLTNMGAVYRNLGATDQARRLYEQAKAIYEGAHDDEGLVVVLNNLAVVEQTSDRIDDALSDYSRAFDIEVAFGNRVAQARLLSGMATVHESKGDYAVALDLLGRSLQLARQTGSLDNEALALHNRGSVRERTGDLAGALDDVHAALVLWQRIGAVPAEAMARFVSARIEASQGRTREALTDAQAAIALNESQRGQIASDELRAYWLAGASGAYELRTELLMQLDEQQPGQGYAEQALEATEAARARSLLDLLTETQAHVLQHADPALVEKLSSSQHALSAKATQLTKVGRDAPDGKRLEREIDDLIAEQDRIAAAIRRADPAYAALTAPAAMTAGKIQALLDPQTVLLDYALGERRSFLWVVSSASVRVYVLPPKRDVLRAAKAMSDVIALQGGHWLEDASAALGAMLLGPAGAEIAGKRLVIVADAALQANVPFAALMLPAGSAERGRLAVEAHEIVLEPSTAALDALRRGAAGRPRPSGAVAVIADPVVSRDDPRFPAGVPIVIEAEGGIAVAAAGAPLARLPGTRREGDAILALAGPNHALARFGFDATREAAEDPRLADYRIIHFAVHGLTNTRTPALSGLVLSLYGPNGAPRDGYLRLGEIFGLSLPVDLVVLSACESGLGREIGGEGLVGMSRGFLHAGAASLVTTLWDVSDESAAELMARFYRAMLGTPSMSPAAALRAAQRSMIEGGRWAAPFHWAAFTIQGEWR